MKWNWIVLTTLVFLAFTANSMAQDNAEQINVILNEFAEAYQKKDLKILKEIFLTDQNLIVFENGRSYYGWEAYSTKNLLPDLNAMRNFQYTITDVVSSANSGSGLAIFKFRTSALIKGKKINRAGFATSIWRKQDSKWRLMHFHTSDTR